MAVMEKYLVRRVCIDPFGAIIQARENYPSRAPDVLEFFIWTVQKCSKCMSHDFSFLDQNKDCDLFFAYLCEM